MARVLVPGGQLMVYVWAMEQKNRHFEKQDVLVPWNRALCSRLSGTEWPCGHPRTSRGCHPAGSGCLKQRCDSKRSHSVDDGAGVAGGCCRGSAKEGEDGDGFYHTLGRSFRSWFFSRSLDESTLRKQIERVKNPEGWVNSTVSIQPSRHPSLDWEPQELFSTKEPNSDEEMLIETSSQKHLDGLRSGGTSKNLSGDHGGERRRKEARHFADITNPSENCVGAGDPGEGDPSTSKLLRRVSAEGDPVDSRAFMRYYHVFREGELEHLLRENVAELRILSSGNDHGNWCVIAQKREGCD